MKYYSGGDFLDLKQDGKDRIKVIGKKHELIRDEVVKILDKARQCNFPPEWEDTESLLTGDELCIIKQVLKGSSEWQ